MNQDEPVALTEAIRLLVVAVLAVPAAFEWWTPTPEQFAALIALFGALSVVLSVLARMRSTPTAKVALTVEQADELNERRT